MKRLLASCWTGLLLHGLAGAQAESLQSVHRAQEALKQQLLTLQAQQQAASTACWQRFAVNDCLAQRRLEARRMREPIEAQLLDLQARERVLQFEQREQRLKDKAAIDAPQTP